MLNTEALFALVNVGLHYFSK